jgi:hypothetical protein
MEFALRKQVSKVGDFGSTKEEFYYVHNNKIKSYSTNKDILTLNDYWGIKYYETFIHVFDNRSKNWFYDYQGNLLEKRDKTNFYHIFTHKDYIYYDRNLQKTMHNNIEICDKKIGTNYYKLNRFYYLNDLSLMCYDLAQKTNLWQFSLSQFGTYKNHWQEERQVGVSKIVGSWKGQLIVLLNNGMFIGLDVENGGLLWKKQDVDGNDTLQEMDYGFGTPYNPFLDEQEGVIYFLQGSAFVRFDLEGQRAAYRWSSQDDAPENYLFIKQSRLKDGLVYFTSSIYPNIGVDNTIGVFDIEQNKVVWRHTFPFEKGVFIPNSQDKIQANEKKLFVLDSAGTLHVFEREDPH